MHTFLCAQHDCLTVSSQLHVDTVQNRYVNRAAHTLTVSMSFLLSSSADLSFMSLLATHVLIWSRNRCSFLICVFKSVSSFSFCVWFVEPCILSYMLSKSSTPSDTFFSVRSISAGEPGQYWYQSDRIWRRYTKGSLCSFLAAMANSEREHNDQKRQDVPNEWACEWVAYTTKWRVTLMCIT